MSRRHRALPGPVMLAGACALLCAVACTSKTPAPAARPPLQAVVLPDLTPMAPSVQAQLRAQFDALIRARQTGGAAAKELATAYGRMGMLLMAAGATTDAEPCLLDANALAPTEGRWAYYLGHLYRIEGQSLKAAAFFERTLELRHDDPAALVWLGTVYLEQGQVEPAESQFARALALQPRMFAALFGGGRAALAHRDYQRAVTMLEAALAAEPRASIVHYPLAIAYRALGRLDAAQAHARQHGETEIAPPDALMQELAGLLQSPVVDEQRGDRALARGDFAAAAGDFEHGVTLAPDNLPLRHKYATALSLKGDVPGAVAKFQDILRRSPSFAEAHYSLGVLLQSSGRYDDAIERFAAAVHFDPSYLEARLQLANALHRRGRFDEALSQYTDVLRLDPRVGEARLGYAVVLVHLERYAAARDALAEAARLAPDQPQFTLALARLLSAAPDDRVRDGRRALSLLRGMAAPPGSGDTREAMAMALAETGQFDQAAEWERTAAAEFDRVSQRAAAARAAATVQLFERRKPARIPWTEDPSWNGP